MDRLLAFACLVATGSSTLASAQQELTGDTPGPSLDFVESSQLIFESTRIIFSLTVVGDLDGNGVGDLAVGVPSGPAGSGQVEILLMNEDATVLSQVTIRTGLGGFQGILENDDCFGCGIAPLGDLDGDGVLDLAVGARGDDDGGSSRGAVWILFLNADGTVDRHQKISSSAGGFTGVLDSLDWFGVGVGGLGDVNGDGVGDLAVGARNDDDGGSNRGAVWVLFLEPDGTVESHRKISSTSGVTLHDDDGLGQSFAAGPVGDLDGNGTPDLITGRDGSVLVVYLNSDGTVASHRGIGPAITTTVGTLFGESILLMDDLNGDGNRELVVGAPAFDGEVHIRYLAANGAPQTVPRSVKIRDVVLSKPSTFLGSGVASLGDLDGNGAPDILAVSSRRVWLLLLNECPVVATGVSRNPSGVNANTLNTNEPTLGGLLTGTVDLALTAHFNALVCAFGKPTEEELSNGQFLLIDPSSPGGEILTGSGISFFFTEPGVFALPIPNDPALCAFEIYVQAIHFGGFNPNMRLSNSRDHALGLPN